MKNIYIFLSLIVILFSSCDGVKDLQTPPQNTNEAVPQVAINAIKKEYPEATQLRFSVLEKSKIWESEFKVKVDDMSAVVDYLGQISEAYRKNGSSANLPNNAKTYIEQTYPNATIKNILEQVGKDGKVIGYRVTLLTSDNKEITVMFDATGTFTLLCGERNPTTNPQGGNPPIRFYLIEQKDLPDAIKAFLAEKHPNYKFIKAGVNLEGTKKTYSLVISKDLTTYDYLFDEAGNVLRSSSFGIGSTIKTEEKSIEAKDLPATIKAVLDKDFKGWEFQKGILNTKGTAIQGYLILVKVDKKTYSLQFDATGKLLSKQEIGGNNGSKPTVDGIQEKDLPKAIVDYLKNKHKDYKYIQISIVKSNNVKTYWVTIAVEKSGFDYTFDEKGNMLKVATFTLTVLPPNGNPSDKILEAKDIPSKIKEYLDKNYKGWVFHQAKADLENGKIERYMIIIKIGNDTYFVSFDENQNFISARKG